MMSYTISRHETVVPGGAAGRLHRTKGTVNEPEVRRERVSIELPGTVPIIDSQRHVLFRFLLRSRRAVDSSCSSSVTSIPPTPLERP